MIEDLMADDLETRITHKSRAINIMMVAIPDERKKKKLKINVTFTDSSVI